MEIGIAPEKYTRQASIGKDRRFVQFVKDNPGHKSWVVGLDRYSKLFNKGEIDSSGGSKWERISLGGQKLDILVDSPTLAKGLDTDKLTKEFPKTKPQMDKFNSYFSAHYGQEGKFDKKRHVLKIGGKMRLYTGSTKYCVGERETPGTGTTLNHAVVKLFGGMGWSGKSTMDSLRRGGGRIFIVKGKGKKTNSGFKSDLVAAIPGYMLGEKDSRMYYPVTGKGLKHPKVVEAFEKYGDKVTGLIGV